MNPINWREHIVCDPGMLGGKPTLKGTPLSIEFVLELLAGGWSRENMRENYPNLADERLRDDRFNLLQPRFASNL